jgi:hypothetical protein
MTRPLDGIVIGISISGHEGLGRYALTAADVNRVTVELSRRLISLGAQVVLGHKWTPGGVMQAVARFAQAYQTGDTRPIVHNYLGWPDRASLSGHERTSLEPLVRIVEMPDADEWRGELGRVRALTFMRRQMVAADHARLFISGSWAPKPGRTVAGVVEEAGLTASEGKAMFLTRMMGGAAENLIAVIRGQEPEPADVPDQSQHANCVARLREVGFETLSRRAGLSHDEMNQLFDAHNLDTVMHLVTRGLRTLLHEGRLGRPAE